MMKIKVLRNLYNHKSPRNLRIANSNYNNILPYNHRNFRSFNKNNTLYNNMNYNNNKDTSELSYILNKRINSENELKFLIKNQKYLNNIRKINIDYSNSKSPSKKSIENDSNNFYSGKNFFSTKFNSENNKKISSPSLPSIERGFKARNIYTKNKHNVFDQYSIFNKYYNNNCKIQKNDTLLRKIKLINPININNNSNNKNLKNSSLMSTKISSLKNINSTKRSNSNFSYNNTFSLNYLLNSKYPLYKESRYSKKSFNLIEAYGVNTYKGTFKNTNEDRVSLVVNAKNCNYRKLKVDNSPKISYFAIYDGHSGDKCCEFLKKNLHGYIFESDFFPDNPLKAIEEAFNICEKRFFNSIKLKNEGPYRIKERPYLISDNSGSCALIIIIINNICYTINLGDSRALYSYDSGSIFYQLSRDQKPNDPIEKDRIHKAGGSIFKSNKGQNNIGTKDSEFIKIPYRILPGRLAVSIYNIFLYFKYIFLIGCKIFWRYQCKRYIFWWKSKSFDS